jgi:hypothetical protein
VTPPLRQNISLSASGQKYFYDALCYGASFCMKKKGVGRHSCESTVEEDLASDVLEIITVFSAMLYGSRSHKNKQIVEQLKDVAKEL